MGTLRFLLALAIVEGHAASFFHFEGAWILAGSRAVQIFYMISGFLMALILNGKYDNTAAGNRTFYLNRAVKIFAPYFVILAASVFLCLVLKATTGDAVLLEPFFANAGTMSYSTWAFAVLTNVFIVGQEWSFQLIYRAGELLYSLNAFHEPPLAFQFIVIGPAWTLSLELMFYLIAPFILRRNILVIAALAVLSHLLRIYCYRQGYYSEALNYRFFPFELSLFLFGALIFRVSRLIRPTHGFANATITIAVALLVLYTPGFVLAHQFVFYSIVGLALPALLNFSNSHRFDRAIGELSYPLYLVHWPVLMISASALSKVDPAMFGKQPLYPVISICACIAFAYAIDRYVVEPLDSWRQKRVVHKKESGTDSSMDVIALQEYPIGKSG